MRIPWIAKKSNLSILKEINPEYSLEGLMLKLQYLGNQMQRITAMEKTDARRDRRQKEKVTTEDEMVRQHH